MGRMGRMGRMKWDHGNETMEKKKPKHNPIHSLIVLFP